MTKKDFELIAAALLQAMPADDCAPYRAIQWQCDCVGLCNALAQTNPRFDRARFLAACGVAQ